MGYEAEVLEQALRITFRNPLLLRQAFIDRTAVAKECVNECNARLGYLGDGILRQVLRDRLYNRTDLSLLELQNFESRLCGNRTLNNYVRSRGWDKYIVTGDYNWTGERAIEREQKREATVFEAIIGAIRLDQSFEAAAVFLNHGYLANIDQIMNTNNTVSAVQRLHEYTAKRYGATPTHSKRIIHYGDIGQEVSYEYRFRGLSGHAIAPLKSKAKEQAAQALLDQLLAIPPKTS